MEVVLIENKLVEGVESLCDLVLHEGRDERIVAFAFLHVVHLLDLTCLAVKSARWRAAVTRLEGLSAALLGNLTQLLPVIRHLDLLRYNSRR